MGKQKVVLKFDEAKRMYVNHNLLESLWVDFTREK